MEEKSVEMFEKEIHDRLFKAHLLGPFYDDDFDNCLVAAEEEYNRRDLVRANEILNFIGY